MHPLYAFDAYPQDPIPPFYGLKGPICANSAGVRKPPVFYFWKRNSFVSIVNNEFPHQKKPAVAPR